MVSVPAYLLLVFSLNTVIDFISSLMIPVGNNTWMSTDDAVELRSLSLFHDTQIIVCVLTHVYYEELSYYSAMNEDIFELVRYDDVLIIKFF